MMYFVTGASGSGKTTALPGLADALPEIDWHDFDDVGVPLPCPREWRPLTTEHWLRLGIANQQEGRETGIAGGAVMGEILACPSAPQIRAIHIAFLDCHDIVRMDRITQRGETPTQELLSWAAWQRVHVVEPQWRQDVICNVPLPEMRWERWMDWRRGDPRWQAEVIDTSSLTPQQVAGAIAGWIAERRGAA